MRDALRVPMRVVLLAALLGSGLPATAPAQERVWLSTADGGVIAGDLYGSGPHGVVLAHGGRFDKESWAVQARAMAEAGLRVLAIDFRGYGESRGPGQEDPMAAPLHEDILAAVRHLRASGATTVSAVGGSMGGHAAANAAAASPGALDRLMLLGSDGGTTPAALTGRVLFVVAAGDTTASGTPRLVRIREHFDRVPPPRSLVVLAGSAHAQWLFQTDEADYLLALIVAFLTAP